MIEEEKKQAAAMNWINSLEYNKFVQLNKAQIDIINSIKDEFNDEFVLKVTAIGVTKVDNEDNLDNYDHDMIEFWDEKKQMFKKELWKIPRRHQLKKIIERENEKTNKV